MAGQWAAPAHQVTSGQILAGALQQLGCEFSQLSYSSTAKA
nr:hypothetical protein [Streptomyces sp. GS7]